MKHAGLISRNKERSRKMTGRELVQQAFGLTLIVLLLTGCGGAPTEPTATLVPPTATPTQVPLTPTPTPTPTEAPFPGAIVGGRVYLMDRDRPVQTTVLLFRAADYSMVDSRETDESGYYSFLVEEPDTYIIHVSVGDLIGDNCTPRTESGWQRAWKIDPTLGVTDELVAFVSIPFTISLGDEITLDCEQYCD
jgi:hypothetical protein